MLFIACSCGGGSSEPVTPDPPAAAAVHYKWDFNDISGWAYHHQDTATVTEYDISGGILTLTTRANTYDRPKMGTIDQKYTSGTYAWRTYISNIHGGDQTSIGSWIYCDDHHELDFEVGYGTLTARAACDAKYGEMVACMTSQDFPHKSTYTPVSVGWHDFSIKLDLVNGKYLAHWLIDGVEKQTLQLKFGTEIAFKICCSVENLRFIGDHIATQDNYGKYDYVTFDGQITNNY